MSGLSTCHEPSITSCARLRHVSYSQSRTTCSTCSTCDEYAYSSSRPSSTIYQCSRNSNGRHRGPDHLLDRWRRSNGKFYLRTLHSCTSNRFLQPVQVTLVQDNRLIDTLDDDDGKVTPSLPPTFSPSLTLLRQRRTVRWMGHRARRQSRRLLQPTSSTGHANCRLKSDQHH